MQEHEPQQAYDYTQELSFVQAYGQEDMQGVMPTMMERSAEEEDLADTRTRQVALWRGRGTVVALGVSFLASLAAFWLSDTLLSVPDQLLPIDFLQIVAANRLLVLIAPAICLILSYIALRWRTAEIMATPERYLDERQKMLRDQAHHSAFKLIKYGCVLIPAILLLPHLPWFQSPSPFYGTNVTTTSFQYTSTSSLTVSLTGWLITPLTPPPASLLEMLSAGGLLMLGLLLIASALPMAALAWKGKA